ncbi:MAG: hypothetical protein A3C36_03170 [Omnitrophica WOR_2 bacterium RIFCSPHIGHO2_02_FULL_52_10]|nr:MAG: hypothetical protein A3C36_03170 [Omnitrophica WOR_2 bacterium RIFCSPHIGHO2_02_FULL_52_10]
MNLKSILSFVAKLSKRERMIFYVTVAVVGLGAMDKFILSPILHKITHLTEVIAQQEEEIKQSLIIISEENRIEEETKAYQSFLSPALTEEKAITEFLKEVENIAKQSSVYLIDMKPTVKNEDAASTKYFVKLNFEAQMEQVMNFFYHVSIFNQLIKVEDFQLRPKTEGSSIISCDMSISKAIVQE